MVLVPDIVGLLQSEAEAALVSAEVTVGTVTTAPSATVAAGHVISQNPAAGLPAAKDSPVDFTVSLGPAPEVSISAEPLAITSGESSTLNWTSTNADTCVIEPGIGSVDTNGYTSVSPLGTTTYTITAAGPGGTATDSVTIKMTSQIALTITYPLNNENITRPDVMVQGTITNASGFETGVAVNGIVAMVDGDQFVANHVPLEEGENIITAIAVDIKDNSNTTSIVPNAILEDYIKVTPDTESGVLPFETMLRVEGSFTFTESQLTHAGPGEVEILYSSADEYRVGISVEGLYDFTAEVTDSQGNTYTDTVVLLVLNETELDALLKKKWEGMREALMQGDVDRAVSSFDSFSKDAYREVFNTLSSRLPEIAQELSNIQLIRMRNHTAEYDIRTIRNGTEYSFYLMFIKDDTGLWKIRAF